jgi:hypothetical protein
LKNVPIEESLHKNVLVLRKKQNSRSGHCETITFLLVNSFGSVFRDARILSRHSVKPRNIRYIWNVGRLPIDYIVGVAAGSGSFLFRAQKVYSVSILAMPCHPTSSPGAVD